jgi:hypothetical protein
LRQGKPAIKILSGFSSRHLTNLSLGLRMANQ